ncbi:unnamed protein product [Penicillium camemberti]|uniref:Str. FM013 n=1 Tax=Penicillium camemberti (strain FM 013) TaxID=1429867 RepID=A0A0G4NTE3_PENC3|nr:unnamed protein product [Penicillium camemberti]
MKLAEPINRSNNEFVKEMHRVEAIPLENWTTKHNPLTIESK